MHVRTLPATRNQLGFVGTDSGDSGSFAFGDFFSSLIPAAAGAFNSYNQAQIAHDQQQAAAILAANQRANSFNLQSMMPFLLIGGVVLLAVTMMRR